MEEGVGSASVSAVVFLFGSFVSEGSGAWFAVVHGGVLSAPTAARCWVAVGAESDGVNRDLVSV